MQVDVYRAAGNKLRGPAETKAYYALSGQGMYVKGEEINLVCFRLELCPQG